MVWKMWDTAGDDLVRDSHAALDGLIVDSDGGFEASYMDKDGNTQVMDVEQPAISGDPSFDVNCRCNLIPFIDRSEADEEAARREPFRESGEPRDF